MEDSAVLLSGGIDSTCVALLGKHKVAYFIDYGQIPAEAEKKAAKIVSAQINLTLVELNINLKSLGLGLLAGGECSELSDSPEWWPFRNQALITIAAMRAIRDGIAKLVIGTVNSDQSRHADGTTEFIRMIDQLTCSQEGGIRVVAPAISMSSKELASRSSADEKLLLRTFSCHKKNFHCGDCPGCRKRAEFFGW